MFKYEHSRLGAIGELLAAIATVGTLIYLALQIRENSKQLRVTSINGLNELINYAYDPIYVSERNTEAWLVGISTPEETQREGPSTLRAHHDAPHELLPNCNDTA